VLGGKEMERTKKVLLVDDDEIHLSMAENILNKKYEVITAKSGKDALKYLINGAVPDLILLDILMPNLDGWEIFSRIRRDMRLLNEVPIVFLTSIIEPSGIEYAKEIGAADYITKPFNKDDFLSRIEKILKK
jgi:putative two-component system response regulator